MKNGEQITCAHALVKVLEENGVKLIFGHPGEQILAFYDELRKSPIKHVLMRHEQGAAHAADGFARSSGKFGVCVATAGPGALNLVMGVATSYKDSVPLLVLTGDVSTKERGLNGFQDIDLCGVFEPITLKSLCPQNAQDAIIKLKEALFLLQNGPTGPIHINLPKDILLNHVNFEIISSKSFKGDYKPPIKKTEIRKCIELLKKSEKPLIFAGSGLIWSGALKEIKRFIEKNDFPLATTYPARGVLEEDHPLCLGLMGTRGTPAANFAGENCDLILGLGCRFSERSMAPLRNPKIVHVNIDPSVLKGDLKIGMDVKIFLNEILDFDFNIKSSWSHELNEYSRKHPSENFIDFKYLDSPLKPQQAINEIINASKDAIIVNDAGTHTTWVTLYRKVLKPGTLLFSGGFGPMGYGLPASIGACLGSENESTVLINGDGGFQMNIQELATLHEKNLPIVICIINNHSLGIIRQWQETYYGGSYQIELKNPDFVELAGSYNIQSTRVNSAGDVFKAVEKAMKTKKPFLIDIDVDPKENIPLPKIHDL
ncbi:thiamine pyrophosphate-binding protein [Methanobacterium alcaliphilum]|uniref:thiamine pyrophosphate-binding protein n=1 Tax=Methanobacterium alcaliphilum TaxID=392018 RepID=UPI00200AE0F5|nr:thiamine pyrophosphate-binding protein [Methanobacterium alcaliphilum]MCK9152579.1 thiamine pyrophosphate-binding protein [Methanobacterium alcaliphilum]